jgi:multiple sugar transport system substrate-binding protein
VGLLVAVLIACNSPSPPNNRIPDPPLRIFWNRGLYPAEDQALQKVVTEWQRQNKTAVQLSFFSSDDILNQTAIAIENGNSPDIVFAHRADYTLEPRWALDGKLVDVSDILAAVPGKYNSTALQSAYLYNKAVQKRSYYGVPIEMQMLHVHYWRDFLAQVGLKDTDIPSDWIGFWSFWQQAQKQVQQRNADNDADNDADNAETPDPKIYGLGLPLSAKASDTYFLFEQILEAYDIELVDSQGQLRLTDPTVRQGLIDVVEWLSKLYQDQYVPPESVNWVDPDNNVNFLNRHTLMTLNPSLSIPASQQDDRQLYTQKIATRELPNKPNGEPMKYLVSVKQALIFKTGQNSEAAKGFLTYLIQPQRLTAYLKESLGRSFPTMPDVLKDPFWKDTADPHIAAAARQFTEHRMRLFYNPLNPAYSQVQAENIWGQMLHSVLLEGKSAAVAVDEAIAKIQKIFIEWQN